MEPRVRRYLPYLVEQVRSRGLPLELALLPIVESTLDPYAASSQGAAGLWQLIPATARRYGVAINWWYDGRRDVVDSTEAALDYLEALHAKLGDWLLVVAAYNCGERRILRARARRPDATFWDIDLPKETAGYVPRLLALSALIRTPEAFGASLPALELAPTFEVSTLDRQVDLASLARSADIPLDDIFRLNPGLNHSATPPQGPHRVLLPLDHVDTFALAVDRYTESIARWSSYKVKHGDTLGGIASRHGTTVGAIRDANALKGHLIHTGDTLVIPASHVGAKLDKNPLLQTKRGSAYYRVAAGDSLWTISRRLGVTIGALVRANHLDPKAPLSIGQRLNVPGGRLPIASR
jgi:membrane-bound lytic murein transglycosylase D